MVSDALAAVLRTEREELNRRFVAARVYRPELDAEVFAEFIRSAIDPLAVAVERVSPERVSDVVLAAYDIGLELVGQKLVGYPARSPYVDEAWRRVLPEAAALVACDPQRIIAAVCNAAHHLSATPGARPAAWIDAMARLAGQCADTPTFLRLGQVAAWRAGMAHFREGALAAADQLPEPLALFAVGARDGQWQEIRGRLAVDPWYDPAGSGIDPGVPRVVGRVGAFRGFGGLFTVPPVATVVDDRLFVISGAQVWLLTADALGATFHRATLEEIEHSQVSLPQGMSVRGNELIIHGCTVPLPEVYERVSSVCASRTTVAITSWYAHAVVLVAIPQALTS